MFPEWSVYLIIVFVVALVWFLGGKMALVIRRENKDNKILANEQRRFLEQAHAQNRMNRPME